MAFRFHFQYTMKSPRKPTSYFFQPNLLCQCLIIIICIIINIFQKKKKGKIFMLRSQLTKIVDTIMFSICHFHVVVLLQQLSSLSFVEYFLFFDRVYLLILISFFLILTQFSKWFFLQ